MTETSIYIVEITFINEALPEKDGQEDSIEFLIPAKSFAEAEEKAIKEAGKSLLDVVSIYKMDQPFLN